MQNRIAGPEQGRRRKQTLQSGVKAKEQVGALVTNYRKQSRSR